MVTKISTALQKVKDHYDQFILVDTILLLCQSVGHRFRQRMLGNGRFLFARRPATIDLHGKPTQAS